ASSSPRPARRPHPPPSPTRRSSDLGVIEDLDDQVRIVSSSEFDEETVTAAASKISTAKQAAEDKRKELEDKRKAQKEAADPYDGSAWAAAGIDPVKITIDSRSV